LKSFLRSVAVLAGLLGLPWMPACAQELYRVTGEVRLVSAKPDGPLKNASQVAVWLVPVAGQGDEAVKTAANRQYTMLQQNKHFEPHLLVVPTGASVVFPNLDPWFHNVFSLYQGKRFDLGLYQAGSQKTVKFDRPGPSYIFCNIHPEMSGVILAVNSNYIGVSDQSGNVTITGVPAGKYMVHVWHELAAQSLESVQREIVVGEEHHSFGVVSFAVLPRTQEKHANKYGQDYDPQALKPDY
jgi:plastocyanin